MQVPKLNVTSGLLVAMFCGFVFAFLPGGRVFAAEWLACDGSLAKPWNLVTYPFFDFQIGIGLIFLIFSWVWLYMIGNDVERKLGKVPYLLTFFAYTAFAGLLVSQTANAVGSLMVINSCWLPVSALTCYWAGSDRSRVVMMWGVVPLQSKLLAIVTALILLFTYGAGNPMIGVVATVPCLVGWLHGSGVFKPRQKMVVSGRGQRAQDPKEFEGYIDKVRSREKERAEREKLRKLFESSVGDESSDPGDPDR